MDGADDALLLRALAGELSPAEQEALAARLAADGALRERRDQLRQTAALLHGARADAFAPGFSARVARRVAAAERSALAPALLQRQLFRLVPAALAAMLVLGGYALLGQPVPGQTPLESLLGLQPVNAETLLSADLSARGW